MFQQLIRKLFSPDIFDLANCASPDGVFNTGVPGCDLRKKKFKGLIFTDRSVRVTPSNAASVAAFIAFVKTSTIAARGSRMYPVWDILNFEDNTGDPATGSVGNLTTATTVTSDAVPAFKLGYNGTELRHQRMSAMSSASLRVFFVDEAFTVYGTRDGDDMIGFDVLQAYADTSKFPVSDTVNQYAFRLTLGSITEYRDLSRYVVTNSGILTAVGLINVEMKKLSLVSNVLKYQPIADGGTNLELTKGGDIDGLTHTAINLETGGSVTLTGVADSAGDDSIAVTIDSTEYTALASGTRVQVSGPSASALSGVGVKPYEFLPIIITKP